MAFDFGESKPSDPTADFLAREREAAGVLSGDAELFGSSTGAAGAGASADDFERSASTFPALDDDAGIAAAPPSNTNNATSGFGFDDLDDDKPESTSANKPAAVDDEVGKFEQNFPELDDAPASSNTNGAFHDDAVSFAPQLASCSPSYGWDGKNPLHTDTDAFAFQLFPPATETG